MARRWRDRNAMTAEGEEGAGAGNVERQIAVVFGGQFLERKAVLSEQVLGLIEPQLSRGRCRLASSHLRPGDGLERVEVRVVKEPATLEPGDQAQNLLVALAGGAHDELGGGARIRT